MNEQALLQQLHDIHDYLPTPVWKTPWPYLGCVIAITIVLLILWYVRRRRRIIPLTIWQQAEKDIAHLGIDGEQSAQFYQQLTDILKRYLQERFSVALADKTDYELLALLGTLQFPSQVAQEIRILFGMVTEIKFGRVSVSKERMQEDRQRALTIVSITVPQQKAH